MPAFILFLVTANVILKKEDSKQDMIVFISPSRIKIDITISAKLIAI